jgi:hypothetical protein
MQLLNLNAFLDLFYETLTIFLLLLCAVAHFNTAGLCNKRSITVKQVA